MERLIINGDPGIRKGAVVEVDGVERVCFSVTRNGDFHGPDRVQLSCVVGDEDEAGTFERREFIPHFLDVTAVDAEDVTVVQPKGQLAL
ncbi:MAG: HAH_0734 family protein [Halobacteriales archaeon]